MRRFMALVLSLAIIVSVLPAAAFAAGTDPTLTVNTTAITKGEYNKDATLKVAVVEQSTTFKLGDMFYVPVILTNMDQFDSIGLQMTYDKNVLQFIEFKTSFSREVEFEGEMITSYFGKTLIDGQSRVDNVNEALFTMGYSSTTGEGIKNDANGYLFFAGFKVIAKSDTGTETIGIQSAGEYQGITMSKVSYDTINYVSGTISVETESSGGESGGTTTDSDYEIWYELSGNSIDPAVDGDQYVDYDVNNTVTATLYIKNTGDKAVSLQAYDIYLTHDSKLSFETFTPNGISNEKAVNAVATNGQLTRIQAIGQNTTANQADINIKLPAAGEPDNAVALGTITFTIEDSAIYNTPMKITLTPGSAADGENSTNIGIADYITVDGTIETTGNKESKYPSVGGTTKGAEVMTTYDVTYNANGGTWGEGVEDPIQEKQYNIDLTLDPGKTPTRTGYEFLGWSTDSGDNNAVNAGAIYTANEDEVFYAVWNQTSFTVEWFGTDGNVIETDNNVAYGATAEFNGTEPSKTVEGYTVEFLGWNTDPDAVAALTDLKITGATKFYPIFKETINQYEVTFDADGGTLADGASTTVKQDYNTPITLPNATKTGHTLEGWYDGETIVGAAGDSYTIKKNVELKANWSVETYTITYMDGTTEMTGLTPTSYTYGETKTLPTPTKEGATFGGWYTVANPGENDSVVTTITATDIGNKTFYAKWTNNTYTIAAVADPTEGGTVSAVNSEDKTTSANLNDTINVTVTPHPGYDIDKVTWAPENGDATEIKITDGSGSFQMPAANVTVTATFKKVNLAVTKDEDIVETAGSVTVKNDKDVEITEAQVKDTINLTVTPQKGYQVTEVSYTYTKDGEEVKTTITDPVNNVYTFPMPGYPVEVSAIFEPIEYNITYMDGESKIENLSPAKYTVKNEQITLPNATKTGYDFKGWYDNAEFTGEAVTNLNPADAEDKTYYARFEIIEYTITYMDGNDQISGLSPSKYTVVDGTVTLDTYTKDGYTFEGWYDNAGFTGTAVATFNSMDVGNKIFYAKLTPIEYTITFDPNGGNDLTGVDYFETNKMQYTIESTASLPTPTNSNPLYKFRTWKASEADTNTSNWQNDKDYDAVVTALKGKYGSVKLTAQWDRVATVKVEEYKYAADGDWMLRIDATNVEEGQEYKFDGASMYYMNATDGKNYLVDADDNGVFYTLISGDYVEDGALTDEGYQKLATGAVTDNRATIDYATGDINGDTKTNIADANIVYQMIVNGGGYYNNLEVIDRLKADMVKEAYDSSNHRATIADVNEIVKIINGTN